MHDTQPYFVQVQRKSMLAALVLTFLFGPIGLLYASIKGAVVTGIAFIILLILSVISFGILAFLMPLPWIASMIWAAVAVDKANRTPMTG